MCNYDYDDFYVEPDEFIESLKRYGDVHYLKTVDPHFSQVFMGLKKFEVRLNDRDFKVKDVLILEQYGPLNKRLTGDYVIVHVTHILDDPDYCKEGYVIMSIEEIDSFVYLPF